MPNIEKDLKESEIRPFTQFAGIFILTLAPITAILCALDHWQEWTWHRHQKRLRRKLNNLKKIVTQCGDENDPEVIKIRESIKNLEEALKADGHLD